MRSTLRCAVLLALLALPVVGGATGDPVPTAATPAPTRFERFVRNSCSPCVVESFPVKPVAISPARVPRALLGSQPGTEVPPRAGQVLLEVMRAAELGRPSHQFLALRITLNVAVGPGGSLFPVGVGMIDIEDVADMGVAIDRIVKSPSATPRDATVEAIGDDFQSGAVRIGLLRVRGDAVAYMQVGDIPLIAQKPVWQVPTSVFIALNELPALRPAINEALASLRRLNVS